MLAQAKLIPTCTYIATWLQVNVNFSFGTSFYNATTWTDSEFLWGSCLYLNTEMSSINYKYHMEK